jgi:hypothetical protein
VQSHARLLIARPRLLERVHEGLASPDEALFERADCCAAQLSIDTFDVHWRRLLAAPGDTRRWYRITTLVRADRIAQIVDLACRVLALGEIASGPAHEWGFDREHDAHHCLTFVLQVLPGFPGHGERLILVGLRSPVFYNRAKAVAVLEAWPPERRTGFRFALARARTDEVDDGLRERIARLC